MQIRTSVVALAVAALAVATLCSGVAATDASAATPSGVTIHVRHGDDRPEQKHRLYGYVFSERLKRCAKHRKVHVFRQRGEDRDPRTDERITFNYARKVPGGKYKWSTAGLWRSGQRVRVGKRYYAWIAKERRCESDKSRTLRVRAH